MFENHKLAKDSLWMDKLWKTHAAQWKVGGSSSEVKGQKEGATLVVQGRQERASERA